MLLRSCRKSELTWVILDLTNDVRHVVIFYFSHPFVTSPVKFDSIFLAPSLAGRYISDEGDFRVSFFMRRLYKSHGVEKYISRPSFFFLRPFHNVPILTSQLLPNRALLLLPFLPLLLLLLLPTPPPSPGTFDSTWVTSSSRKFYRL